MEERLRRADFPEEVLEILEDAGILSDFFDSEDDEDEQLSSSDEFSSDSSLSDSNGSEQDKDTKVCLASCGHHDSCSIVTMLSNTEKHGAATTSLLHAHADILFLLETAKKSAPELHKVDWTRIQVVVEQIVAGDRRKGRKQLEKELRENKYAKANEAFEQSSQRLLEVMHTFFSSSDDPHDGASTSKTSLDKTALIDLKSYAASLDRKQRRALVYVQQLWRKSFRRADHGAFDLHKLRLDLCYDFSILFGAHDCGHEILVCADPASGLEDFAQKCANFLNEKGCDALFNLCGRAAEDWRLTLATFDGKLESKVARFIGIRGRQKRKLHPAPVSLCLQSAKHAEASQLFIKTAVNLQGPIVKGGTITATQARRVLEQLSETGTPLPNALKGLPSLLALCATTLRQQKLDMTKVPSHLRAAIEFSYECIACKGHVAPQPGSNAASASTHKMQAQAAAAGFSTKFEQAAALLTSIRHGDPWFPPLIEEMCYLAIPNSFHIVVESADECRDLHRSGHALCHNHWPRTPFFMPIWIGGRGTLVARDANDKSKGCVYDENWQFCVGCAKHHLCDPVSRQPSCGCPLCAYEASVLRNEQDTHMWRHHEMSEKDEVPAPVRLSLGFDIRRSRCRVVRCPYCAEGDGWTCDP